MNARTPALVSVALGCFLAASARAGDKPKVVDVVADFEHAGRKVRLESFEASAEGKYPAVLFLPGIDGVTRNNAEVFRNTCRTLAAGGYVVVLVYYLDRDTSRLLGEFRDMLLAPDRLNKRQTALWGMFLGWGDTVKASLAHVRKLDKVNADRVGLVGLSLGGFLASLVASDSGQKVSAVVTLFAGVPPAITKDLKHFPPALVLSGDRDEVVPAKLSRAMRDLLRDRKLADTTLHVYDQCGHCFEGSLWAAVDSQIRIAGFFADHLRKSKSK